MRSFMDDFTNLRENIMFWSFPTLRNSVFPKGRREQVLSAVLRWGCCSSGAPPPPVTLLRASTREGLVPSCSTTTILEVALLVLWPFELFSNPSFIFKL